MTETIFMRLSEDWALAYDANQWIVCKRKCDRTKTGEAWRAIAFVGSKKAVLMRVLREKGAVIAPGPLASLASDFPDTFREWIEHRESAEPDREAA